MTKTLWTEAHQREALRWLCTELGALEGAHMPITIRERDIASEMGFRRAIVREIDIDGQDVAMARVCGLAEGRLVRETAWGVRWRDGGRTEYGTDGEACARALVRGNNEARIVRVTRIRRAR